MQEVESAQKQPDETREPPDPFSLPLTALSTEGNKPSVLSKKLKKAAKERPGACRKILQAGHGFP
jgi:hypothetical protein